MAKESKSQREREVLWLTASEERLLVFVILHWSNLAFNREITLKRTKKVSSIISSKKILSQVTVSLKNGQRRVQIAQSAIISLNIVNGSLGRESALFVGVQRGEKFSTLMWESQQLIHRLFATYEERAPMHSLLMCYACADQNLNTTCFFLKKTAIQVSKEDAIPRLWGAYQKWWRSHLLDQKSSFKVPTRGIAHPDRWKKSKSLPRAENKLDKNWNNLKVNS